MTNLEQMKDQNRNALKEIGITLEKNQTSEDSNEKVIID